jgi:hypothetical protein
MACEVNIFYTHLHPLILIPSNPLSPTAAMQKSTKSGASKTPCPPSSSSQRRQKSKNTACKKTKKQISTNGHARSSTFFSPMYTPIRTLPTFTHLQHLPHNLRRLLIRLEQLLALLPLGLDLIVLVQQLLEQILFIQRTDKPILHRVLRVVDEEVHNGLGDLIGHGFAHNVEVRGDEAPDEFRLEGFALREGGRGFGVRGLRGC